MLGPVRDGNHVFYTVQHRLVAKSKHGDRERKLKPCKEQDWGFSCFDYFRIEPWAGSGHDYKPQFRDSYEETHSVRCATGREGWWTLKFAVQALRRLRKADTAGKHDYRGLYNELTEAARHEFRIVKITISHLTEPVSCEDLMEALVEDTHLEPVT